MAKPLKSENQTVSEQITDAVNGTDDVIEVAHPGAAPMLVMASFPIVLFLAILLALGYFAFFCSKPKEDSGGPLRSETSNTSD